MTAEGKIEQHLGLSATLVHDDFHLEHTRHAEQIGFPKLDKLVLIPADAAAIQGAAWPNPAGVDIIVLAVIINLTTEATGAATADVGIAANATTASDTIMDGIDIGAAAAVFNSASDAGTNGGMARLMTATQFITVDAVADDTGLVGDMYIVWVVA